MKNSKRKSENTLRQTKIKTQLSKTYGMQQKQFWEQFIAIQAYLKKQENFQMNNLTLHLNQLEKEEQKTPKLAEGKKS